MRILSPLLILALCWTATAAERPNIVLILADDLGYGDLHCYGGKEMITPNLDKLATEGLRMTSWYAGHPNCSPSRTALMTGRTPSRVGVRNWIPEDSPMHLRASEITIATLLKKAGYTTCHSGKWHLNGAFNKSTQPQPADHGFDHWFSTQNNAAPSHKNPNNFVRNGKPAGPQDGYSAHVVVSEALNWLKSDRDASKPFFLYVCFHEPHEPIASDEKYSKLYPSDVPTYSAHHGNITQMDDACGRLLTGLDDMKLRDNTLVIFTSDNGPAITPAHPHGSAGPLRNKKGSCYDGGIREPGIIRWPGHTRPGTTNDEPVGHVDFLPTICEITGTPVPEGRKIDGASWLAVLSGQPVKRTTPLYWHFNQAIGGPLVALRHGDWKILATLDKSFTQGTAITAQTEADFHNAELKDFQLYNLKEDIGESKDLAATESAKLTELQALLAAKYREVRDESPTWPAWQPPVPAGKKKK